MDGSVIFPLDPRMNAMNRTREQFVERWKRHIAGLALFGTVSEIRDGPLVRASKVLDIPAEVESLLGKMYDDLKPKIEDTPLPVKRNGDGATQTTGQLKR